VVGLCMDPTALRMRWRAIHNVYSTNCLPLYAYLLTWSCFHNRVYQHNEKCISISISQSTDQFQTSPTNTTTMTSTTPGVCLPGYASHFGINNIPFGIASSTQHPTPQCVSRFEDTVIFLADIPSLHQEIPPNTLLQPTLNALAALPRSVHQELRQKIQQLLQTSAIPSAALEPLSDIIMALPVRSPDFTDFSCSADHVLNASEAMTGSRSAPPSFFHQPVGYAGRCSSLDVSGSAQERPLGQFWAGKPGESEIVFGASRRMDYELEVGVIVGKPSGRRERVRAEDAGGHIFGFVLVNDWSGEFVMNFLPWIFSRKFILLT
jgi:fumarylacetoacetase